MRTKACVIVVLLLMLGSVLAVAQDVPKNAIRGGISYHMPDAEETVELSEFEDLELEADDATGFFLAYEVRFSKMLGVELFATRSESEWTGSYTYENLKAPPPSFVEKEDIDFTAVTLGLNVHVFGRGAIDFYVAPLVGYAFFGEEIDDDIVYGAGVGLDVGFGKRGLAFTASVRYLKSKAEAESDFEGGNLEIDFDPLIISAGLAYRF